ncbi:protein kti12 [Anaeramoeba ignava]|uniref:Protein kti12 n=1 Tax=Anaeramoeba ignava TaxID=1746090 RepID=A0A9Q0R9N0_ANAIG|nr:protein kti12 [Anaeramoeba ignava]
MPFVLICGRPSTGKTKIALDLQAYFTAKKHEVILINEENLGMKRKEIYKDIDSEKAMRTTLRDSVVRHLSKNTIVILDSVNGIKGFRYEIFCSVREVSTSYCVVYCDFPIEKTREWNEKRLKKQEEKIDIENQNQNQNENQNQNQNQQNFLIQNFDNYPSEIFEELSSRFEEPQSKNKWDSPLFLINEENETLEMESIEQALFSKNSQLKPTKATQIKRQTDSSFLYQEDKILQEMALQFFSAQKNAIKGDIITLDDKITNQKRKISFLK